MPVRYPRKREIKKYLMRMNVQVETSLEALSKMKPAFKKDGVGTAGMHQL
jgi:acetyl-CoA acetyltransferase